MTSSHSSRRASSALFTLLFGIAASASAQQASPDGLWNVVDEAAVQRSAAPRQIVPQRYLTVQLDRAPLQRLLQSTPLEASGALDRSASELSLPLPDGRFERFRIVESPIMEPALAAKYPQLRTYLGQGIDDPSASLRFDLTPLGFRAQVISWRGTHYIDPYQPGDLDTYVVYRKADAPDDGERIVCAVTGQALPKDLPNFQKMNATPKLSSGTVRRTYRAAIAATGEYTAFHGGSVIDGLAAVLTTLNRVNGVYERELSVRMVLVANNDLIIYTNGATDPYTNDDGGDMLGENQSNLSSVIGGANYDIGHVVSTGGGGVASLGSVCSASNKARGVTGSGSPVGDAFDVDYVAHEMGHQFRGNHTFNGSGDSCSGGNRNGSTAYEPGSGISIQAYAGICGADNTQPNSEDYFQRVSLNEMLAFTTTGSGANCGTTNATGNTPPAVSTAASWIIPARTPFELSATGSDANGDTLTYLWEQFDLGAANAPGVLTDTGSGPLFRSFAPSLSPNRVFPSLRYILNNANVAPATAPLPGTTTPNWFTAEVLPTTSRTLNFRVTARDNRAGGGGTNEALTAVAVRAAAGPFAITAPNTATSWAAGSTQTVTWNVAGTTANDINTANVRITLSLDGGNSWPIELAASTANDGSETVTIPAGTPASAQARIRVQAVGNIFFDINDADLSITSGNTAPAITVTGSVSTRQGSPTATAAVATVSDSQDAAGSLLLSLSGAPPELSVSAVNSNGTVNLSATADCSLVAPGGNRVYPVLLTVTDSAGAARTASVNVNVSRNLVPTLGNYSNQAVSPGGNLTVNPSAAAADGNNNLVGVSVSPTTLPGGGTLSVTNNGDVSISVGATTPLGAYPVQVEAADSCGAVERRQFNLQVASTQPQLSIASSTVATGNGLVEPNECNQFNVTLSNLGTTAATGVTATLSTTTPNVSITQASTSFANIAANGGSQTSLTPFQISSSGSLVCFSQIDLQLNVSYSGGGSPFVGSVSLPVGQQASENYQFSSSAGASLPAGGTLVAGSQVDDAVVNLTVPAGFNFSVYDTPISGGQVLRVSTNGNLQIAASGGSADWSNGGLPSAGNADAAGSFPTGTPVLAPYWDDLDLRVAGSPGAGIYQQLTGSAPNRRWLIEWRGKHVQDSASGQTLNFAIEFSEASSSFAYLYAQTGAANANGSSATVGIQAASTGTRFSQFSLNAANLSAGLRLQASLPAAVCSPGTGSCASAIGAVLINQSGGSTSVVEGGASDSYSVVLDTQPSGTVTFTATPDTQLSVSPTTLSFDALNWNLPQNISVSAVNDAVVEGAHSGLISHSVSGGGYSGASVAPITVSITDNDSATVTTANVVLAEGDSGSTPLQFVLQLNGQVAGGFNVSYATRSDSAVAGQDFTASTGSVSFDGSANPSRTVTVQLLGDTVVEADERFFLDLSTTAPGVTLNPVSPRGEIVNDDFGADLQLTLSRLPGVVSAGGTVSYVLTVNNGSALLAVPTVNLQFTPAALLQNISWTCTASAGSNCAASGSGALTPASLAIGGTATYTLVATVAAGTAAGTEFSSSASASPAAPFTDPNLSNNSASVSSVVGSDGLFADGFESP